MSHEMTAEARLEHIEEQLAAVQATLDLLVNYMQAVSQHMGLRDRVSALDEQLSTLRPEKRESIPEPKTDPGYKNGE
jgi:uncharacterized coiled-coil protein SlyX